MVASDDQLSSSTLGSFQNTSILMFYMHLEYLLYSPLIGIVFLLVSGIIKTRPCSPVFSDSINVDKINALVLLVLVTHTLDLDLTDKRPGRW